MALVSHHKAVGSLPSFELCKVTVQMTLADGAIAQEYVFL
jgi:hypothetical protein